jgi:hypothetical protein
MKYTFQVQLLTAISLKTNKLLNSPLISHWGGGNPLAGVEYNLRMNLVNFRAGFSCGNSRQ